MGAVRKMQLDEAVQVDGAFLGEVRGQLGRSAADRLITDALGSLAVELEAVGRASAALPRDAAARAQIVQACDRLSRMAWELGLTTLSGVAVDLGLCAERGDLVALPAVEARLQRVGRRSLDLAWEEAAIG